MRWDDIEILKAIDQYQEQHGGIELWNDGRRSWEQIAGDHVARINVTADSSASCSICETAAPDVPPGQPSDLGARIRRHTVAPTDPRLCADDDGQDGHGDESSYNSSRTPWKTMIVRSAG